MMSALLSTRAAFSSSLVAVVKRGLPSSGGLLLYSRVFYRHSSLEAAAAVARRDSWHPLLQPALHVNVNYMASSPAGCRRCKSRQKIRLQLKQTVGGRMRRGAYRRGCTRDRMLTGSAGAGRSQPTLSRPFVEYKLLLCCSYCTSHYSRVRGRRGVGEPTWDHLHIQTSGYRATGCAGCRAS